MANQVSVPYPHPNYDDDLLAKEIVNGTYIASINMMIHNSKTGDDRYVYAPDSPDIIETMQDSREPNATDVNSIDNNPIVYDRNKSLEDAVLPVKKDTSIDIPIIVSTAMCPQSLDYVETVEQKVYYDTYKRTVSRYDDGINKFLVVFEKTDDGESTDNSTGDVYTFFKYVGTEKTKLFDVAVDDYGTPLFVYSIGKRNFFCAETKLYEYSEDGFLKLLDIGIYDLVPFLVMEEDNIYLVGYHGDIKLQSIDDGSIIESDFSVSRDSTDNTSSAYDFNYFRNNRDTYYVENGEIKMINSISYFASNARTRFDYLYQTRNINHLTNFNEKNNHFDYPFAKVPAYGILYLDDVKEAYVTVGSNGEVYFTKDYITYKSTGVVASGRSFLFNTLHFIAIFEDYIYIIGMDKIDVFSVSEWRYNIPRSDLGEEFAKHDMINRDVNVIGD